MPLISPRSIYKYNTHNNSLSIHENLILYNEWKPPVKQLLLLESLLLTGIDPKWGADGSELHELWVSRY